MMPGPRLLALLLPALFACGEDDTGDLTDRPVPMLEARPRSLVFGRVPVGAAARQPLVLENVGNADGALTLAAGSGPTCDAVGASAQHCLALELGPLAEGETREATVAFFPRVAAPPSEVRWTVECGQGCAVTLSGRGSGVEQAVEAPAMLDFGRLHPGCEAEEGLKLRSVVDVPLEVRSVRIEADFDGVFTVTLPSEPPFTLDPGAQVEALLRFTARDGDVPAVVHFEVVGEDLGLAEGFRRDLRVELIGRGDVADPPCE